MENEINEIKNGVNKVVKSLLDFMKTGHIADNICHLRTNASLLNVLADRLCEIRSMEEKELVKLISNDKHSQFIYNKEKNRIECRCGHAAVWWKTGYICGTITAYPCEYNK